MAVIIVHVWGVTGGIGPTGEESIFSFGQAGVDQFFVISGFIISSVIAGPQTARKFLGRRALRIYPFYWALTLAWIAMLWAAHKNMPSAGLALWSMPALPLQGQPALGVGWSLEHEAIFYLIAAALIAVGRKERLLETLLALAGISIAANLVDPGYVPAFRDWHLLSLYHVQFMLGAALFRYRRRAAELPFLSLLIVGLLLFPLSAAVLHWAYHGVIPTQPAGVLGIARVIGFGAAGALTLAGLLSLERHRPGLMTARPFRAIEELGNASYGLYLSHSLIFAALAFGLPLVWPASLPPLLAILPAWLLALSFAVVWYRRVERPFLARFERRPLPPLDGPA